MAPPDPHAVVKRELLVRYLDAWVPAALHASRRATYVDAYATGDSAEAALRVFGEFTDLLARRRLSVVLVGADGARLAALTGEVAALRERVPTPAGVAVQIAPRPAGAALPAVPVPAGSPLLVYLDAADEPAGPAPDTAAAAAAGPGAGAGSGPDVGADVGAGPGAGVGSGLDVGADVGSGPGAGVGAGSRLDGVAAAGSGSGPGSNALAAAGSGLASGSGSGPGSVAAAGLLAGERAEALVVLDPAALGDPADAGHPERVEAYRHWLRGGGAGLVACVELVAGDGRAELVFFATPSAQHLEVFKEALWAVDEYAGVRYRDPRDPGHALLDISLTPHPGPLRRALLGHLRAAGARTVGELRRYALTDTVYRAADVARALTAMVASGTVHRDPPKGRLTAEAVISAA